MQTAAITSKTGATMSDCKCENCGCTSHCGTECNECANDVCQNCNCEKCNPTVYTQEWAWQDSGIELGF